LINDLDLTIVREAVHGMNSPGLGARDILRGNAAISVPLGGPFRSWRTFLLTRFNRFHPRACFIAVIIAAASSPAREQSVTGSIQGTVVDSSGGVLPGVTVTITNTATGAMRTSITDSTGAFRAELLPVGPYEVGTQLQGFAPQNRSNIDLWVGVTLTLRVEVRV